MRVTAPVRVLRKLHVAKLLMLAEVLMLAHDHYARLEPHERRRVLVLVRIGHGRPSRLSAADRDELRELVAKAEPRLFAGTVADKLSPVKLPRRLVQGRRG